MFAKLRVLALLIIGVGLSLVLTGVNVSGAQADVNTATPGARVAEREPSECLGIFDVRTNDLTRRTYIAYYGSDLPLKGNTGKVYISIGNSDWTWTVHKSTHYDTKYLGTHNDDWVYVVLKEGSYTRCTGYYQAL